MYQQDTTASTGARLDNSDDELEVRSKSAALAPSIEVLKYIFTVLYTYLIYWKCISKILQQVPVLD